MGSNTTSSSIYFLTLLFFMSTILIIQIAECGGAKIEVTQLPNGKCQVNSEGQKFVSKGVVNWIIYKFSTPSLPYYFVRTSDGDVALVKEPLSCKGIFIPAVSGLVFQIMPYIPIYAEDKTKYFWGGDPNPCRYTDEEGHLIVEFKRNGEMKFGKDHRFDTPDPMKLYNNFGPIHGTDGTVYLLLQFYYYKLDVRCPWDMTRVR